MLGAAGEDGRSGRLGDAPPSWAVCEFQHQQCSARRRCMAYRAAASNRALDTRRTLHRRVRMYSGIAVARGWLVNARLMGQRRGCVAAVQTTAGRSARFALSSMGLDRCSLRSGSSAQITRCRAEQDTLGTREPERRTCPEALKCDRGHELQPRARPHSRHPHRRLPPPFGCASPLVPPRERRATQRLAHATSTVTVDCPWAYALALRNRCPVKAPQLHR